nr:MAG TPA: hypothetical protein [Caudoviricetes sp.]
MSAFCGMMLSGITGVATVFPCLRWCCNTSGGVFTVIQGYIPPFCC